MKTKFITGPWSISDLRSKLGAVYIMADRNFAQIYNEWKDEEVQMANARLIASAPDLLFALQCGLDLDPNDDVAWFEWRDIAFGAIKKSGCKND